MLSLDQIRTVLGLRGSRGFPIVLGLRVSGFGVLGVRVSEVLGCAGALGLGVQGRV